MKIVLPVHHFPPRYTAGAELYTFRLARWLITQGHQVGVVCIERTDQGNIGDIVAEYDIYEHVPVWRLALNLQHPEAPFHWSYKNPTIGRWFAGYLAEMQPDLVHLQSGYLLTASVLEAARAQGIPSVVTLHDFWFLCPRTTLLRGDGTVCETIPADPAACAWCMLLDSRRYCLPDRITGGLVGKAARALQMNNPRKAMAERRAHLHQALGWADKVIAPSRFLAGVFANAVEPARLEVVRLGLDTSRLLHTPPPADHGPLRLGYIGQIAPHKGIHILVRAMQMLPPHGRPIHLSIYGDPHQNQSYSRRLRKLISDDPRIHLAGRFENSRIAEVLGAIDTIVVPSIWYENSPLSILEAHAAGRPVLASAMGGMAEFVHHEVNGLHFRPGDPADLVHQIQRLREEPELLAKLRQGTESPPTVDDEMATLFTIYQRLVRQRALSIKEVG